MSGIKNRSYPVPKVLRDEFGADTTTLDEMEFISTRLTAAGVWAQKVLTRENDRAVTHLVGPDPDARLPRGVLDPAALGDGYEIVTDLLNYEGKLWRNGEWVDPDIPVIRTTELSEGDIGFIARAFHAGDKAVILSSAAPLAFIPMGLRAASAPEKPKEAEIVDSDGDGLPDATLPKNSIPIAIVDTLHNDAVLELLALAPGPHIYRRHDGQWISDDGWVQVLKAVTPPPMVKLEEHQLAPVMAQVDRATEGVPWKPMKVRRSAEYRPIRASNQYIRDLQDLADERAIAVNVALLAVAGRELSPKDYVNTERLRRYWLYGKGAAKIRWFTPGAWRRCYRNLVKYIGPRMTPGYCTNLSERLGGQGVATHVGDK